MSLLHRLCEKLSQHWNRPVTIDKMLVDLPERVVFTSIGIDGGTVVIKSESRPGPLAAEADGIRRARRAGVPTTG